MLTRAAKVRKVGAAEDGAANNLVLQNPSGENEDSRVQVGVHFLSILRASPSPAGPLRGLRGCRIADWKAATFHPWRI